jgi:hypothetical protein
MSQTLPVWWSDADQAELEMLVGEVADAVFAHRGGCRACVAAGGSCEKVTDAIRELVDWREARVRTSRAAWLRGQRDLEEWAAQLVEWAAQDQALAEARGRRFQP